MLAGVGDARHVVQVLGRGLPVAVVFRVGNHDRGAGRGEVHPAAAEIQVVPGILAVQHQVAPGQRHGIFNYGSRHSQAAVATEYRAGAGTRLNAVRRCLVEAYFFQDPEDVFVYGLDVNVFQRPELAARLAGMNGLEFISQRRAAQRPSRLSAAGLSRHRSLPPGFDAD